MKNTTHLIVRSRIPRLLYLIAQCGVTVERRAKNPDGTPRYTTDRSRVNCARCLKTH